MCLTAFGLLNGLVGIFGTAFAVASDDAFNDDEDSDEEDADEPEDDNNNGETDEERNLKNMYASARGFNTETGSGKMNRKPDGGDDNYNEVEDYDEEEGSEGSEEGEGRQVRPLVFHTSRQPSMNKMEIKHLQHKLKGALGAKSNFALQELTKMAEQPPRAAPTQPRRTLRDIISANKIGSKGAGSSGVHPMFAVANSSSSDVSALHGVNTPDMASPDSKPRQQQQGGIAGMFGGGKKPAKNLHAAVGMFASLKNQKSAKNLNNASSSNAQGGGAFHAYLNHNHQHNHSNSNNNQAIHASQADVKAISSSVHTLQRTVDAQSHTMVAMMRHLELLTQQLHALHPGVVARPLESEARSEDQPPPRKHSIFFSPRTNEPSPETNPSTAALPRKSSNWLMGVKPSSNNSSANTIEKPAPLPVQVEKPAPASVPALKIFPALEKPAVVSAEVPAPKPTQPIDKLLTPTPASATHEVALVAPAVPESAQAATSSANAQPLTAKAVPRSPRSAQPPQPEGPPPYPEPVAVAPGKKIIEKEERSAEEAQVEQSVPVAMSPTIDKVEENSAGGSVAVGSLSALPALSLPPRIDLAPQTSLPSQASSEYSPLAGTTIQKGLAPPVDTMGSLSYSHDPRQTQSSAHGVDVPADGQESPTRELIRNNNTHTMAPVGAVHTLKKPDTLFGLKKPDPVDPDQRDTHSPASPTSGSNSHSHDNSNNNSDNTGGQSDISRTPHGHYKHRRAKLPSSRQQPAGGDNSNSGTGTRVGAGAGAGAGFGASPMDPCPSPSILGAMGKINQHKLNPLDEFTSSVEQLDLPEGVTFGPRMDDIWSPHTRPTTSPVQHQQRLPLRPSTTPTLSTLPSTYNESPPGRAVDAGHGWTDNLSEKPTGGPDDVMEMTAGDVV